MSEKFMPINNKAVSSWVRQARYRAKRYSIHSDLDVSDVQAILKASDGACRYCGKEGQTLDCPFPLKTGGPNVPANVVPCCKKCKSAKNNNDVVWMFSSGLLTEVQYMAILQELFQRRGGDKIKEHVRRATGME
jgi:hypothetical protein